VDDTFDVMLHYPGGMRAVLRSTMLAAVARPRFLLHGTRGAFLKQTFDPQEINLRNGITFGSEGWKVEPEKDWGVVTTVEAGVEARRSVPSAAGDYRDYYANVRDAMLGKAELAVSPENALHVMRVLEMARESSGKRCTIPW
jgi:scyllo-inositol 2-dehydrogenase (NADP+)